MMCISIFSLHGSVRQQTANLTCLQELPCYAAENPFAQPAMTVTAGDQQISLLVLGKPEQLARDRPLGMEIGLRAHCYAMTHEIVRHILEAPSPPVPPNHARTLPAAGPLRRPEGTAVRRSPPDDTRAYPSRRSPHGGPTVGRFPPGWRAPVARRARPCCRDRASDTIRPPHTGARQSTCRPHGPRAT